MKHATAHPARRVDKPWGYELIWAHTERYVGKTLHIEKGSALSYQYHRQKDETIHVLSGRLQLEVAEGDEPRRVIVLTPGESFRIHTGLRHRMIAIETCDVLEASTAELDDVVRIEDHYGRAGTSTP
ncbi:MAG: cupin domain-containing protein [Deltaproteobacteria bacterium]|nr:cupin domain-containing protein [Deltaproteobacteria bacterium]MBI3388271.1 cupin domain-containing protein [Deltaproteobacteria bacterium]